MKLTKSRATAEHAESAYAWTRLLAALLLSTIGGVGMWSVIVALPAVQAEFGVARSEASLPYTMTMIGVGVGGVLMGRLSDRFGIILPVAGGAISLSVGYVAASAATNLWQFTLAQALFVGVASSVTFGPLLSPTPRSGSPAVGAWRWPSLRAEIIWRARSGHRSSST